MVQVLSERTSFPRTMVERSDLDMDRQSSSTGYESEMARGATLGANVSCNAESRLRYVPDVEARGQTAQI